MSLPWSNSLVLRVEPHGVYGQLQTGWPRRKRLTEIVPTGGSAPRGQHFNGGDPPSVDPEMLEAVLQEFELAAPLRGARLIVELADSLVHFDVAEGDFGTQSDRQLQSIAAACMAELLGDSASEYEVRWSLQAGERHLLIAALARACIATLATAAKLHGLHLESVQPGFARRWNSIEWSGKAATSVFAVTSGSHAVVTCVVDRAVCAVSVGPWEADSDPAAAEHTGGETLTLRTVSTTLLDERAARLLASLGIATTANPDFVLVTPDATAVAASSRWVTIEAHAEAA